MAAGAGGAASLVAKYWVGKRLGSGSWGEVRACVDRTTGERLACKSIARIALRAQEELDDVAREIDALQKLGGRNGVIGLRGMYADANAIHIVMELCQGGDLFDALQAGGPFPEPEAADIVCQLAAALAHCHGSGIIHRDVKLENILLTETYPGRGPTAASLPNKEAVGAARGRKASEGGEAAPPAAAPSSPRPAQKPSLGRWSTFQHKKGIHSQEEEAAAGGGARRPRAVVKLADFGLSVDVTRGEAAREYAGSAHYVAPEVARHAVEPRAAREYGFEADIWSLGIVAYMLLANEFPFGGHTNEQLLKTICRGQLHLDGACWPLMSPDAKDLLSRMLAPDPRDRPTAQQVLAHPWVLAHASHHPAGLRACLVRQLATADAPPLEGRASPTEARPRGFSSKLLPRASSPLAQVYTASRGSKLRQPSRLAGGSTSPAGSPGRPPLASPPPALRLPGAARSPADSASDRRCNGHFSPPPSADRSRTPSPGNSPTVPLKASRLRRAATLARDREGSMRKGGGGRDASPHSAPAMRSHSPLSMTASSYVPVTAPALLSCAAATGDGSRASSAQSKLVHYIHANCARCEAS